jgi:hypothetical protein
MNKLKNRSEMEWLREIEKISPTVRRPVAKIVWWDHFASRPCKDRAKGFDKYLTPDLADYPTDQMIRSLIIVGYHPSSAASRMRGGSHRASRC